MCVFSDRFNGGRNDGYVWNTSQHGRDLLEREGLQAVGEDGPSFFHTHRADPVVRAADQQHLRAAKGKGL